MEGQRTSKRLRFLKLAILCRRFEGKSSLTIPETATAERPCGCPQGAVASSLPSSGTTSWESPRATEPPEPWTAMDAPSLCADLQEPISSPQLSLTGLPSSFQPLGTGVGGGGPGDTAPQSSAPVLHHPGPGPMAHYNTLVGERVTQDHRDLQGQDHRFLHLLSAV